MWNVFRSLKSRSTKKRVLYGAREVTGWSKLSKRPSREDIILGYRVFLGRDPESEAMIEEQMRHPSVASFRLAALKSKEFRWQYIQHFADDAVDPYWWGKSQALAFVHLQKTGGTTLRSLLEQHYQQDKVCPLRFNLHALSVSELAQFDFFSGHFDLSTLRYIPRKDSRAITIFREPRSRLISIYRFHKAHPLRDEFAKNRFVMLAHELSAEEFFEHPEVRSSPEVFNNYLLAFGRAYSWFVEYRDSLCADDLIRASEDAKQNILKLAAFGITEKFQHSVNYIFEALGLPVPATIQAVHITDDFPKVDTRFNKVDRVEITARLNTALDFLTKYDQEIYRFALAEFDRRCPAA